MRSWLALLGLILFAAELQAITWNFDAAGDSQGWRGREGFASGAVSSNLRMLHSEVVDGVWRVYMPSFEWLPDGRGRNPSVELIAPQIGRDSALFDRVIVCFRLVHARPVHGSMGLTWTNEHNEASPGRTPPQEPGGDALDRLLFAIWEECTYTTDWQEFTFSGLESGPVMVQEAEWLQIWEGELIDFRLQLNLYEGEVEGPEGVPEAVEIDWIWLTGVEEQLQGELPPPEFTELTPFGELFEDPVFYPLGIRGIGGVYSFVTRKAALGDLDGDGDLDLVTLCSGGPGEGDSWLTVYNDGNGAFEHPHRENIPPSEGGFTPIPFLDGDDLDGDGRMDLLFSRALLSEIMYNDEGFGLVVGESFERVWPLGLGDGDGDGDGRADLWLVDYSEEEAKVRNVLFYRNEGSGFASLPVRLALGPGKEDFYPFRLVFGLGEQRVAGVLWWSTGQGMEVTYLKEGDMVREHLAAEAEGELIRCVGDWDLDGDVDLVVGKEVVLENVRLVKGLDLLINQGDGSFEEVEWYGSTKLHDFIRFFDLNADGVPDPVFVDSDARGPGVVVSLGVRGGLPVQEGRYPLEGPGGIVLAGDVDGDGDVDLVVTERSAAESGGVYVLQNRLGSQGTSVAEEAVVSLPNRFWLGVNFPNPFNPQTWIPFEIPEDGGFVDLRIYNVLGQPVRTLVAGRLGTGRHLVPWDGRDDRGESVSSGVYLYYLNVGDRSGFLVVAVDQSPEPTSGFRHSARISPADRVQYGREEGSRQRVGGMGHQRFCRQSRAGVAGFSLDLLLVGREAFEEPEDVPDYLEIDWIRLTGVEEQIQGELQPVGFEVANKPGELFESPVFLPLLEGIGRSPLASIPTGALGDVDGDGYPDLVAEWERDEVVDDRRIYHGGWLVAANDRQGGFRLQRIVETQNTEGSFSPTILQGADLNGDRLMDLIVQVGLETEIMLNDGEGNFSPSRRFSGHWLVGLIDGEGDGDRDLLLQKEISRVVLRLNDGSGDFAESDAFAIDTEQPLRVPLLPTDSKMGGDAQILWVLVDPLPGVDWISTWPWASGEAVVRPWNVPLDYAMLRLAADVDGDGDVDLLGTSRNISPTGARFVGLQLLLNHGAAFETVELYDDRVQLWRDASAGYFNGDGVMDIAFVDGNEVTGPCVVVLVGRQGGIPREEGRYAIPGNGREIFGGDLNQDGMMDLVVLEPTYQGGGVFILQGKQGDRSTEILTEGMDVVPSQYAMRPCYPNPFNPRTWIPFEIPEDRGFVDLRIYNVLGQPIRTLVAGRLTSGYHLVPWDGRDERGESVSSGVYLYRLEVDDWSATGRMIRSR